MAKQYPEKGTPEWHQLQIAKKTVKMTPVMASLMGGMSVEEAEKIMKSFGLKYSDGGDIHGDIDNDTYMRVVNHFVYFSLNYPDNFLDAFGSMKSHLSSKFDSAYKKVGSYGAMFKFWTELDSENREALCSWAKENYKGYLLRNPEKISVETYCRIVNHFVAFSLNYPKGFLNYEGGVSEEHAVNKFNSAYKIAGSWGAMVKFWAELDMHNRSMFAAHTKETYTGEKLAKGGVVGSWVGKKVKRKTLRGGYNNYEVIGYSNNYGYQLKDSTGEVVTSATTKELENDFEIDNEYKSGGSINSNDHIYKKAVESAWVVLEAYQEMITKNGGDIDDSGTKLNEWKSANKYMSDALQLASESNEQESIIAILQRLEFITNELVMERGEIRNLDKREIPNYIKTAKDFVSQKFATGGFISYLQPHEKERVTEVIKEYPKIASWIKSYADGSGVIMNKYKKFLNEKNKLENDVNEDISSAVSKAKDLGYELDKVSSSSFGSKIFLKTPKAHLMYADVFQHYWNINTGKMVDGGEFKTTLELMTSGSATDGNYNPFKIPVYKKDDLVFVFAKDIEPVWLKQQAKRSQLNQVVELHKKIVEKLRNKNVKDRKKEIELINERYASKQELEKLIEKAESTPIHVSSIAPKAFSNIYFEDGTYVAVSEFNSLLSHRHYHEGKFKENKSSLLSEEGAALYRPDKELISKKVFIPIGKEYGAMDEVYEGIISGDKLKIMFGGQWLQSDIKSFNIEKQKANNVWLDAPVLFSHRNEIPPSDSIQTKEAGGSIIHSSDTNIQHIFSEGGNVCKKTRTFLFADGSKFIVNFIDKEGKLFPELERATQQERTTSILLGEKSLAQKALDEAEKTNMTFDKALARLINDGVFKKIFCNGGSVEFAKGGLVEDSDLISDVGENQTEINARKWVNSIIKEHGRAKAEQSIRHNLTGKNPYYKESNQYDTYLSHIVNREMAEGGSVELGKDGLKHALLEFVSAGTIGGMTGLSKYKDIDGVRHSAIQMLQRDGDKPYSMDSLKALLDEAKYEWAENKSEMRFSEGGEANTSSKEDHPSDEIQTMKTGGRIDHSSNIKGNTFFDKNKDFKDIRNIAAKISSGEMFKKYRLEILNVYLTEAEAKAEVDRLNKVDKSLNITPVLLEERGNYYVFNKRKDDEPLDGEWHKFGYSSGGAVVTGQRFFKITYQNKWKPEEKGYFHAENHLEAIKQVDSNVKRITNDRFREIETTGEFYCVEEEQKGGKTLIFEVVNENKLARGGKLGDKLFALKGIGYEGATPEVKFHFNANDLTDAISKGKGWGNYHSLVYGRDYVVEEAGNENVWLHNEYIMADGGTIDTEPATETVFTKDGVKLEKRSNKYKGHIFYCELGNKFRCKGFEPRFGDCVYEDLQTGNDVVGCVDGFYFNNPLRANLGKHKEAKQRHQRAFEDSIKNSAHKEFETGGDVDSFKVGDYVWLDTDYGKHYGKIKNDYTDKTFYVGHQYGYQIEGIGDLIEPERLHKATEAEYLKYKSENEKKVLLDDDKIAEKILVDNGFKPDGTNSIVFEEKENMLVGLGGTNGKEQALVFIVGSNYQPDESTLITKEHLREILSSFHPNNIVHIFTNAGVELHTQELKQNEWKNLKIHKIGEGYTYANGGGVGEITAKDVLDKYFGSNVYTDDVSGFDIKKKSISDDEKAKAFIEELKAEGYLVKKKSTSMFTVIMGVKKKFAEGGEVGEKYKSGDFVFTNMDTRDASSKTPFIVSHWSHDKYYILGDGSHYVAEEKLSPATEKDFVDYYGQEVADSYIREFK